MRVLAFLLLATTIAISPASAQLRGEAESTNVKTPSGHAEMILLGRRPHEALVQLEHVCAQLGWRILPRTHSGRMKCDLPSTEKSSVLVSPDAQALYMENWTAHPVLKIVSFEVDPTDHGVHVSARAERRIPHISDRGKYVRQVMEGQQITNGLMNIIALAGDTAFVPGTTFGAIGYLGFRSDRYTKIELDGEERTAIQVGAIESGSPVDTAGLRTGDYILMMNGRYFDEYRDVSKFLRDLKPKESVTLLIERVGTGERVTLSTVTSAPPASLALR